MLGLTAVAELQPIQLNIILGGFALFLVGIHYLGEGLTELAGSRISDYIEKYTSNLMMAILMGTVITAIMNSSTAVTVISISLVRAGMMTLKQAIGISVGANIGTTMTTFFMSMNIEDYGYYFVFIGVLLIVFTKRKVWSNAGYIFFGFGLLFVGLDIMSEKLLVIQYYPWFQDFMFSLKDNSWLALGGSTLATVIINSSSAIIGITQTLFSTGQMEMVVVSAFVFGSNVGTTLTAVVASMGGSVSTRRAGWFHALYNVIGALLGMLVIVPYSAFVTWANT
ncbi:Na/Pi cotransporter family protein [Erysipelothrix larvae]|uniref:Na/Pi cotransporter family protein n=1 Tax=Erysipelothrix larvae TaxID=1514105 RepID=UPI000A844688|nr:Na/Pi symporter [Erysipelothrix larvae]